MILGMKRGCGMVTCPGVRRFKRRTCPNPCSIGGGRGSKGTHCNENDMQIQGASCVAANRRNSFAVTCVHSRFEHQGGAANRQALDIFGNDTTRIVEVTI